jgi:GDP-L-fucose synthase
MSQSRLTQAKSQQISKDSKVFVAGHRGLVGSHLTAKLQELGFRNLLLKHRSELDLTNQEQVNKYFKSERPDIVYIAAGKVGGIVANQNEPAEFLYQNIMIAANVMSAAATYGTKKLLYLGSSCIYPKMAEQPIKESSLLTSTLEKTNEGYALAKIAGVKMCEYYRKQYNKNFISAMPCNLYGPRDNFHPENSHVIPGMMRRFHNAVIAGDEQVVIWGTGNVFREFLHVQDLAAALPFLMEHYESGETINVGSGQEMSIRELAESMAKVVGFKGKLVFDASKPDGTPRKIMDNSKIAALGWVPKISFLEGLAETYKWAVEEDKFSLPLQKAV